MGDTLEYPEVPSLFTSKFSLIIRPMSIYINNIISGVFFFPLVAFLMTLPYLALQYRKYGAVSFWKSVVVYAFAFYLICAYFMVILPLPASHIAAECGAVSVAPKLAAFTFVGEFAKAAQSVGLGLNPSTWVDFLKQSAVYTTLFNVLLTMPLGMFARYLLNMKWWQALILGLCMTSFYELSQLTGLWGIYDYAYRLCDVDDIIVNTFGCMLGYWIMIPLCHHLPSFKKLNDKALERGAKFPSFTRRLVGFAIDITLSVVLFLTLTIHAAGFYDFDDMTFWALMLLLYSTGIFFLLIPVVTHGKTIGLKIVGLKVFRRDGSPASGWRIFFRYFLFVWVFLCGPQILIVLMPPVTEEVDTIGPVTLVIAVMYGLWLITVIVRAIRSAFFKHPFLMLNGMFTDTMVMTYQQAEEHREAAQAKERHETAEVAETAEAAEAAGATSTGAARAAETTAAAETAGAAAEVAEVAGATEAAGAKLAEC